MRNVKQELCDIICPICGVNLPSHSRGKTLHGRGHDLTPALFALKIENRINMCACGCGKETRWIDWSRGFAKFKRGHMSKESRVSGLEKLVETLKTKHWSRGLTKETSSTLKELASKTSKTLRERFSSGNIEHWSRGKTAKTDERIASAAKKRSVSFQSKNHWNFMCSNDVIKRINEVIEDRFSIINSIDLIDSALEMKTNNRTCHIEIKCNKCKSVTSPSIYDIIRYEKKICNLCKERGGSEQQKEIEEFVKSLLGNDQLILISDRTNLTGYEIDVFVPEKSFAIEFNGLYWHSSAVQHDRTYHNKKSIACKENGISLLHIFHDEWRDKRSIVESMIKNRLGLSASVGARKCQISILTQNESKEFFNNNHLDGDTKGFITYCLLSGEDIIAAIKFRRPYSKRWKGCLEIARFACKKNTNVSGGYSKLLLHAMKFHSEKIISYVDSRFGGSGLYCEKAGMKIDHISQLSFWWTDRVNRFNRLYCRSLNGKTEKEVASEKKLLKIWGCANLVYTT